MTDLVAALDLPGLLGPVLGLGASGALLAVRGSSEARRRVPWVATPLAPLPVLATLLVTGSLGLAGASGTALEGCFRGLLGSAAALGCLAAGWTAAQLWRHVELLATVPATEVDAVLGARHPAAGGRWLVLRGVLGAAGAVRSPGGVLCAFYDAELHSTAPGRAGTVLSRERAASRPISLCGTQGRVRIGFSPQRVAAPMQLRRSRVEVEDGPLLETLSWEAVGVLGATALAIGRMERGAEGEWRLVGGGGGPAPLVLAGQREAAAQSWSREARRWIAVAVPLAMLAALCLAPAG